MRLRTDSGRRRFAVTIDVALVAAAVGGALCILWVIVSGVFGLGLVSFSTGSMVPTYPIGSIALVQTISPAQAHVGDVVTVDLGAGLLPITHRIMSITPTAPHAATLVLKGDANMKDDPAPYHVVRLRRVVVGLPMVASVIRLAASPLGMLGITALLTVFVTWSLWPRTRNPLPA